MKSYKLKETSGLVLVVALSIVLRWWLAKTTVVRLDLETYKLWGLDTIVHGLRGFFSYSSSDYTPGYILVLWGVSKTYWWFMNRGIVFDINLAYKTMPILVDGVNLILVYLILKTLNFRKGIWAALAFFTFWPAWWIVSAQWGQSDGVMMMLFLISFLCLVANKWYFSAIALGVAQAVKPVAILALPIYLVYLWKRGSHKLLMGYCSVFGLALIACYWPLREEGNVVGFLLNRQWEVVKVWPYLNLNGFNVWVFVVKVSGGLVRKLPIGSFLGVSQSVWGGVMFSLFWFSTLLKGVKIRNKESLIKWTLQSLSITYSAMFMFLTGMHERHLYYGAFWGVLALASGFPWMGVVTLNIVYLLNLQYTIWLLDGTGLPWSNVAVYLSTSLSVLAFTTCWWHMVKDKSLYKMKSK